MVSYCVQGCASEWISEPEVKVFLLLGCFECQQDSPLRGNARPFESRFDRSGTRRRKQFRPRLYWGAVPFGQRGLGFCDASS
jgi:hypothetical protein